MEDTNYKAAVSLLLKSIQEGRKFHEYTLEVGLTPQVLLDVGVPQLPMVISAKIIDKVHFDHGISETRLQKLYDLIAQPREVFRSDSPFNDPAQANPVVVITLEIKDEKPIIVAVHPNQAIGRRSVNLIKSMYDKPEEMIAKWREKGLLLWSAVAAPKKEEEEGKPAQAAPVVTIKKTRKVAGKN